MRDSIDALDLLKAAQIRPLVVSLLKHFEDKELKRALPMLVCWTVRFLIVGKLGSGSLENGYSERAKEVSSGTIKTATALHDASKTFLSADDEFEQAFRTARVSAHYLARFYLRILGHTASPVADQGLYLNGTLGGIFRRWGKFDEAVEAYAKGAEIECDPRYGLPKIVYPLLSPKSARTTTPSE